MREIYREVPRGSNAVVYLPGIIVFILLIASLLLWFSYGDPLHGKSANEASAVGTLLDFCRAAEKFRSEHPATGYPQSLAELSASRDTKTRLEIDPKTASGQKNGYRFLYVPRKSPDGSHVAGYEIFADPLSQGHTGYRHFFVDQGGILRSASRTRASVNSKPLLE